MQLTVHTPLGVLTFPLDQLALAIAVARALGDGTVVAG